MKLADHAKNRMILVVEPLGEFPQRHRGQVQLRIGVGTQEPMSGPVAVSAALTLQIDQEARVQRYSSQNGSSGGRSFS